ncbi:hypothetical protein MATL_G00136880 [Megalops atlanticus]|uniref:Uncharacterized protein n=1 Tax=Megalops atlanticus TaxID=7932 RepID=A0A9D3PVR5_MEGAT|nr:hypothetical protein MATL_G00136880 [Megalops atlanticus]
MREHYRTFKDVRLNCMCRCQWTQMHQQQHGRGEISWQNSFIIRSLAWSTTELDRGGSRRSGERGGPGGCGQRPCGGRWRRRRRCYRRCYSRSNALNCFNKQSQIAGNVREGPQQHLHAAKTGVDTPDTLLDCCQLPLQHVETGLLEIQERVVLLSDDAATV